MKLSLVIPVYNVEKYIKGCLDSILQQNVSKDIYEIIIINDGTLDNSMSIVHQFADKYENIRIFEQENKGLSAARNLGLEKAQGRYVWFIDSDDTITKSSIIDILEIIDNKEYDVISIDFCKVSEITGETHTQPLLKDESIQNSVISGVEYFSRNLPTAIVPRYIFKREFLRENDLYFLVGVYFEDIEYTMRTIFGAKEIYLSNKILYNYLIRESGSIMTSKYNIKRSYDMIRIVESLENFRDDNIQLRREKNIFNKKIFYIIRHSIIMGKDEKNNPVFKTFITKNKDVFKRSFNYTYSFFPFSFKKILEGLLVWINPLILISYDDFLKKLQLR